MSFRADLLFEDLAAHLKKRRRAVRDLAVMCALERWVQFEAAALISGNRTRYGVSGGTGKDPTWWITCEHEHVDLWLLGATRAAAVEFKALHNNKNFYAKIAEIRSDLSEAKRLPLTPRITPARCGIVLSVYARYQDGREGGYQVLRASRRPVTFDEYRSQITDEMGSGDRWYGGVRPARLIKWRDLVPLDGAAYIEAGLGSMVSLGLVA